jgi:hypothetical protein
MRACLRMPSNNQIHLSMLGGIVIVTGNAYGGNGGGSFTDLNLLSVSNDSLPERIMIKSGIEIDSIQVNYRLSNGSIVPGTRWGGSTGNTCDFLLNAEEKIIRVRGRFGGVVNRLQFLTDQNRSSTICGGSSGVEFDEQYPGHALRTISGSYGHRLDRIQFHWLLL